MCSSDLFGAQFGARAGAGLKAETFRFLLALLILAVALRIAQDIVAAPREPFSATPTETFR